MSECKYMLQVLERQVNTLEESIDTSNNEVLSEEIRQSICSKEKTLKLICLINSVINVAECECNNTSSIVKDDDYDFEERIRYVLNRTTDLMQHCSTDAAMFEYEVDSLTMKDTNGAIVSIDSRLYPMRKGVRITSYKGQGESCVIIPKSIEGVPVVCIGAEAFKESDVSEVIIPSTVLAIFSHAFFGCKNLEHIDLSHRIRHLGDYCFSGSAIRTICFPDSLSTISSGCCFGCEQLESIELGHNVLTIESGAFMNCTKIKNIDLPNSITRIGSSVFSGTSLKQIIFPENMRLLAKDCFCHPYLKGNTSVTCIVKGKETTIKMTKKDRLQGIAMVYCYPGSEFENIANTNRIPVKPINEFRMEDYQ